MVTEQVGNVKVMGVDVTPAVETGHRAWWAYLGALGLAQDEINHLVARLLDRGAITEKEGRKLLDAAAAWPQKGFKNVEAELQHQLEVVLKRLGVVTRGDLEAMNLPTRADIQALGEKVAALARKVDQLRKLEETPVEKAAAPAHKPAPAKKVVEEKPAEAKA